LELILLYRTTVMYLVILAAVRIMGKREVGELSSFDFVVAIMIAELAAMSIENTNLPLHEGFIPILTLVFLEILLSFLSLKSHTIRKLVDGSPSIVIANGKIIEHELRKQRYNLSDLLGQLREKGVANIADVQYAVLETSGELSVMLKSDKRPITLSDLGIPAKYEGLPTPLIFDGHIHYQNLHNLSLDEEWLRTEIQKAGVESTKDILYASLDTDGKLYISEKEKSKRKPATKY